MLFIRILEDEMLQEEICKVFSGLLPHKNYNSDLYVEILNTFFNYLRPDELQCEYNVFYNVCLELKKLITASDNFKPNLTRELYKDIIVANLLDLITKPEIKINEMIEEEGLNPNLEVAINKQEAAQALLVRCLDLYDKLFNAQVQSEVSLSYITSIKNSLLRHCASNSIYAQSQILSGGLYVGRREYKGIDGWSAFTLQSTSDLSARVNDMENNVGVTSVDTLDKSKELLQRLSKFRMPLADYGIPPLDDETPILAHRLVVVCAKEGTGKTRFAINSAVNLMLNGKKVFFVCGETPEEENYGAILSNYIWKKYGKTIDSTTLSEIYSGGSAATELPDSVLKLVTVSMKEIADSDLLKLYPTLHYETLYSELVDLYNIHHFDGLFVDHSCSMTGLSNDEFGNVKELAVSIRQFKKQYPVYCQVLSQLSASAKEFMRKGQMVDEAPTRGNGVLAQEADDVLIMYDTETSKAKGCLVVENYKRRLAKKIKDRLMLKTKFSVSAFIWRDQDQVGSSTMGNDPQKIENAIDSAFGSTGSNEGFSGSDNDFDYSMIE